LKAPWLGSMVQHEGFPLALRVRPQADSPANRRALPHLVALTHHLAHIRPDGLPEPSYNDDLASFDGDVIECLERYGAGLVVLVETFAGRRTYYAYAKDVDLGASALAELGGKHPGHHLTESHEAGDGWGLFARYRALFPW
jgi:hypothetical protein